MPTLNVADNIRLVLELNDVLGRDARTRVEELLGAVGLALSSTIRQLENFAGVMNFVIFPAFFLSSALYPLWKMAESSRLLYQICAVNPFTHAVETIRFALYGQIDGAAVGWTTLALGVFLLLALWGYDPARGLIARRG